MSTMGLCNLDPPFGDLSQELDTDKGLDRAIRYYYYEGDVRDLTELAKDESYRSNSLYILSECGKSARKVWKQVVKYTADANERVAYWALDIVQSCAATGDEKYILQALNSVNLLRDSLFAKSVNILATLEYGILQNMLTYAANVPKFSEHIPGLKTISRPTHLRPETLRTSKESEDKVNLMYACATICRVPELSRKMRHLLPIMVQEDLAVANSSTRIS